ncbi:MULTISPECIES: helix-turn-helix domain-containing protein [Corallococcus]|uniref:helix-turn-helix domain-containing protein n=1 Tax=Corallococcus TaxID=83461 RepID=UPI001F1DA164|nr:MULTISPECIES: helix-turn-helix domain-containing protein [Corallococcus]
MRLGALVGEWTLARRMAEARRLRGTDAPMDAFARQVDYTNVTHFIRQFRRRHGPDTCGGGAKATARSPCRGGFARMLP